MAKRATFVTLLILCVAAHKKIQSPKDAEQTKSAGQPMKAAVTKLLVAPPPLPLVSFPRTNMVYKKRFAWSEDEDTIPLVKTYTLYMGTNSGVYNWSEQTGTNLFYDFVRTNWEERVHFHYVVVTATDEFGYETEPSNEIHFPAFPMDRVRISWDISWEICTLYWGDVPMGELTQWNQLAVLYSTNKFEEFIDRTIPAKFYRLDKPDVLRIELFNLKP